MKRCSKCGLDKSPENFYKQPSSQPTRDGLTYWCKACYADHYRANRERQMLSSRRAQIRRKYGIDLEEYDRLMALGCTVCGSHERMTLDHCHTTNEVRAPLCNGCNVALGAAHDDPERLMALAQYLLERQFVSPTPSTHKPRYTGPDDATLRRLYEVSGLSTAAIGEMYGMTGGAILKHLRKAGITRRPRHLVSPARARAAS